MSKLISALRLIAAIALCQAAGLIGSFFTVTAVRAWYGTLTMPSFAPANWVFGPMWTFLYILMGISLFLVWRQCPSTNRRRALVAFAIQFFLNTIWSPVFFGLHALGTSVVVILLLLFSIIIAMIFMHRVRPAAAYLFIPYLLWVLFASALNITIWWIN